MNVPALVGEVVFGSPFEMGVRKDACFLEHDQRAIHRRGVDAGHPPFDSARDRRSTDVSLRPHDLGDDRSALGREAEPPSPQGIERFGGRVLEHMRTVAGAT